MDLLNERGVVGRRRADEIAQGAHLAAAAAGESDRGEAQLARGAQRSEHVRGPARGGQADEHVAGTAEAAHLPCEHLGKAVVIADRGEHGAVGGERDRRQRAAVELEAREELGGDVLGVRGAAAVAGEQHLAAGAKRTGDAVGDRRKRAAQLRIVSGAFQHRARIAQITGDGLFGRTTHGESLARAWYRAPPCRARQRG